MQCSSCGAPNKDEAKFCAECGKPLVSGTEDEQIDRLVDYLVDNWFDDQVPTADERQRLREAARDVHAKWKANPRIEDVEVKIDEPTLDVDESFDADELAEIFSGREAAERAEEKRRQQEEEAQEQAEEAERRREEHEKRSEKAKEESQSRKFGVALTLGLIGVTAAIIYVGEKLGKHKEHEEEPSTNKHESHRTARTTPAAATTTVTPVVEPPPPVAIPSCTCVSRANGKNTFVLERPADGSGPWHMKWTQVSGFTSMNSGFWLGESDAGAMTSIRSGTTQLHAVMACENDIVAVVTGDVASAWTGTESGELLWTRKLPAPYAFPTDAGVEDAACAPALGVTGNVFTVPLVKGKTIGLSIRDGSIIK